MDCTRTRKADRASLEKDILSQIVDAILAAESELVDASEEQWNRALVASCRRQKQRAHDDRSSMVSTC
jgi:hypothetical protein